MAGISFDEDESSQLTSRQIAISTAKIFRGLTISRDGTVTSRKVRGSSHHSSKTGKLGEKSRQAAKIDKAKDLVEQSVRGETINLNSDKDQSPNMISLFIMGEFDDMKHLVRDGSKKLKESQDISDEALFAINTRRGFPGTSGPFDIKGTSSRKSKKFSVPPKLKSHPRDVPTRSHNHSPSVMKPTQPQTTHTRTPSNSSRTPSIAMQCSEFGLFGGDSDWSEALNLSKGFNTFWNCGASNNVSTTVNVPVNSNKYTNSSGVMIDSMKHQQQLHRYHNHANTDQERREDMYDNSNNIPYSYKKSISSSHHRKSITADNRDSYSRTPASSTHHSNDVILV